MANLKGLSLSRYTIQKVEYGQDTKNHLVSVTVRGSDAKEVDGYKGFFLFSNCPFEISMPFSCKVLFCCVTCKVPHQQDTSILAQDQYLNKYLVGCKIQ